MINASFDWEEDEVAALTHFTCVCGHTVDYEKERYGTLMVKHGDQLKCPACNRFYRLVWQGMILEEIKE